MTQHGQGLVEAGCRLPMSGARGRLVTGLAQVEQRLVPDLAAESMVGEPLDVLGEAVPMERFDRVSRSGREASGGDPTADGRR